MVHFTWQAQCFCILDEDVGGPRRQICGRRAIFDLQKSSFSHLLSTSFFVTGARFRMPRLHFFVAGAVFCRQRKKTQITVEL